MIRTRFSTVARVSRPEQRERLLSETMTLGDAATRYGVSYVSLWRRLKRAWCWHPTAEAGRYRIVDIEQAVRTIRRRMC